MDLIEPVFERILIVLEKLNKIDKDERYVNEIIEGLGIIKSEYDRSLKVAEFLRSVINGDVKEKYKFRNKSEIKCNDCSNYYNKVPDNKKPYYYIRSEDVYYCKQDYKKVKHEYDLSDIERI